MHKRIQALGRLKTGQQNSTEAAYGAELETQRALGVVAEGAKQQDHRASK